MGVCQRRRQAPQRSRSGNGAGGSHTSQAGKLTSAAIDAHDFVRGRNDRKTQAHLPEGTLVAVTGGKDATDPAAVFNRLDKVRQAAERERVVWDDDMTGFGIRVHPSGRKVYIVKYRHEGRAVKATIGPHGPITPAAARARAAEIVTLARTGRNLEGKTPRKAGGATMADLARRFMDEYASDHLKPGTAALSRKIIEKRILPRLGKRRVADIGRADAAALHHDMRSVPGHANRTLGVLSRMLTMAEVWEMRPEGVNPRRFVKKYPERKRERFLSDDEYRRLGAALRDAEREGFASPAAIATSKTPSETRTGGRCCRGRRCRRSASGYGQTTKSSPAATSRSTTSSICSSTA